jgi:hypothetical protein
METGTLVVDPQRNRRRSQKVLVDCAVVSTAVVSTNAAVLFTSEMGPDAKYILFGMFESWI